MKMYHSSRIFSGEGLLSGHNIKYWSRVYRDAPYNRILNRPFDIDEILFTVRELGNAAIGIETCN